MIVSIDHPKCKRWQTQCKKNCLTVKNGVLEEIGGRMSVKDKECQQREGWYLFLGIVAK